MPKGVYLRTKEYREKISKTLLGRPSLTKGKKIHSAETKKRLGEQFKQLWTTEEYREKMRNRKKRSYSPEYRERLRASFIAENNPKWKEKPGYIAIHEWISRHRKKPDSCQSCNAAGIPIDWANVDHKYRRNVEDYIPLCKKCHKLFDDLVVEPGRFLGNGKLRNNNTSGYRGVSWSKQSNRWVVQIVLRGKKITKFYSSKEEAGEMRTILAKELFLKTIDRLGEKL